MLWPGVILAAWTLLLWSTRIRNALDDSELVGWTRTWQIGISVLFVVVGIVLGLLSLVRPMWAIPVGLVLAVGGSIWWAIRGTGVVLADYELGFTLVHVALAIGTIVLSAWFVRGQWPRINNR